MKDQNLHDIFHAYRPAFGDDEKFMNRLIEQMDVIDRTTSHVQLDTVHSPYRLWPLWMAGIAAAIAIVVLVVKEPTTSYVEPDFQSRLPEYYITDPMHQQFSSYDEIVSEIEESGRQLQQAIAQL
ncbi:MAG: hypothetical protein J6Y84_05280 [Bacteroidaceae bacterium]|nr:hypothetical protein [Bacteroidaceae bacterium]